MIEQLQRLRRRRRLLTPVAALAVALAAPSVGVAAAADPQADRPASRAGFDAFLDVWGSDRTGGPADDRAEAPRHVDEPIAHVTPDAEALSAGSGSDDSALEEAAPILLALLGVAVVLLGIAALPPATIRVTSLGILVAERRLEIGLVGAAVLASAAIGVLVALIGG